VLPQAARPITNSAEPDRPTTDPDSAMVEQPS
jgi:hypothetical protein